MSISKPYFVKISMMIFLLCVLSICLASVRSVYASEDTEHVYNPADFAHKNIALLTGTIYDKTIETYMPTATPVYFNTMGDYIEALRTGKVDAIIDDEAVMKKFLLHCPDLVMLKPLIATSTYGVAIAKDNPKLLQSFNDFLTQIKTDGTYDDMIKRWSDTAEPPPMPAIDGYDDNAKDTLVMGTSGDIEVFTYMSNSEITGFDLELSKRFAAYMGMKLQVNVMDFGALIPAIVSGKIDFSAAMITITDERKNVVDFSNPYYTGGQALCVRRDEATAPLADQRTFFQKVASSFNQNILVENRWKLIVNGLGVTLLISFFAFVWATLLGLLVCFLTMSKNKILNILGRIYTVLFRGIPIVVLLMMIYYIVFAKVNVNPILVAIIGFGLNTGAYIGEILRSSIASVDKGQIEAARSMGFGKVGAFFTVTFPQAIRAALPLYKSEFVSLVKSTAVVGYIAIVDLTKAGDIIRSRTYDAFFPLIFIAVIYLLATGGLVWLFDQINALTDKRSRRIRQ